MARAECTACGIVFSGETSFDKHRTGGYGESTRLSNGTTRYAKHTRRCMSVDEMTAKGMAQNKEGLWVTTLFEGDSSFWRKDTDTNVQPPIV